MKSYNVQLFNTHKPLCLSYFHTVVNATTSDDAIELCKNKILIYIDENQDENQDKNELEMACDYVKKLDKSVFRVQENKRR